MKKTVTKTITEDEFYCDICGKKLNKAEQKYWPPYVILHYNDVCKGKSEDRHSEYSTYLDLCKECNEKVVDLVLYEFDEFCKKVDRERLVKLFKESK